ncbi:MAG TPA: ABC transporter substrate-binding protein [Ktedonobacteraceae bacterium]|nr:ABC transporter substrate-binding protein [Ktedonobacteraceae bacterium]
MEECPFCKTQNRDGVRFCSNCGKELNPPNATATPATSANAAPISQTIANTAGGSIGTHVLTPGSRLQGGRYIIKKVLGQGGMGAALLATDIRLDSKPVVIKELISDNTDPAKLQEDVRNFKREVATLAHIDHPLVPNVTDHFQEGSQGDLRYFMVQEYIEGENLEERMDRVNQPMKEREALSYASQVLDILDYLAQQTPPIVHRDIKPANIIIGAKDKRAHLVDFGIARAEVTRNAKRKQTAALGTPGYAPPEQYQGNADPRSDLYALAATMHHLLTNRDPRNHPPFSYPPARALNPQLLPDIEKVLTKALNNDINQRYQSAAAMKRDIDDILLKNFGMSGNMSSYILGTSGPISTVNTVGSVGAANTVAQPTRIQPTQAQPVPPPIQPITPLPSTGGYQGQPYQGQSYQGQPYQGQPYQPVGMMNQPPQRPRKQSHIGRNLVLLLIVVFLIAGGLFAIPYIRRFTSPAVTGNGTPGVTTTIPATVKNGIGAFKSSSDNELIGVSDGTVAFDTPPSHTDSALKLQAATALKAGDPSSAETLWSQALQQPNESNDAEVLIYLEDQNVLSSGKPYITIVVGTILTGANAGVGEDDLQGAYTAQKEYNDGFKLPNSVLVRLLIANAGTNASDANIVAQQIVQAAQADKTIVGVMGWPYSSHMLDAIGTLATAHIPMVSQSASSDALTGKSPYFFRVAPSNQGQAIAGAGYVEKTLHAKTAALFIDPSNSYTASLGNDFKQKFLADGNTIVATENYTVGQTSTFNTLLQDALSHNPSVIYFAGYASDVGTLLTDLPVNGPPIMGGDALYELSGYPSSARANFNKLHFTSFAYPDEWRIAGIPEPAFFTDYAQDFDPNHTHVTNPYHYSRPDSDAMLSYDAMLALLNASGITLTGTKTTLTPVALQLALTKITGANAIQGVSGQIAFGPNGDPVNKAFVIIQVTLDNALQAVSIQGCYTKGAC